MSVRRLIWGLDAPGTRPEGLGGDDLWFGDVRQAPVRFDVIALFDGSLQPLQPWLQQGQLTPPDLQQCLAARFEHYAVMLERTPFGRDADFAQRRDWLMLAMHGLYTLLQAERPAYAFFVSPPHFGVDLLLSDLCEALQIPVYWGYQSLFAGQFWLLTPQFERVLPPVPGPVPALPAVATEQLFYMQSVRVPQRGLLDVLGLWLRVLLLRRVKGGVAQALRRVLLQRQYQRWLARHTTPVGCETELRTLMAAQPYVYVPLHLQPEMTTTALGGMRHHDQATLVEDLLQHLPPGWRVLVKENPKQDWQCRSEAFWARLMSDPRVLLLPRECASKQLIAHSQLVAVVSGTAGWEAIRMGKPVLSFGWCWYGGLPGVQPFVPGVSLQALAQVQIDAGALQQGFATMMQQAWSGVLDPDYLRLLQNPSDAAQNPATLSAMLACLDERAQNTLIS